MLHLMGEFMGLITETVTLMDVLAKKLTKALSKTSIT
jgi:hypothetical protein